MMHKLWPPFSYRGYVGGQPISTIAILFCQRLRRSHGRVGRWLHYRILGSDTSLLATNGASYVKLSTTPEEAHLYNRPILRTDSA